MPGNLKNEKVLKWKKLKRNSDATWTVTKPGKRTLIQSGVLSGIAEFRFSARLRLSIWKPKRILQRMVFA